MPNEDYPLTLHCHPATPAPMVRALEARAAFNPDGSLTLAYRLWGDTVRLAIPQPQPPTAKDSLWEHTCFEAFIGIPGHSAYREFNFSPSSQWAAHAFFDYRQRDEAFVCKSTPIITSQLFAGRFELIATIPASALPHNPETLEIGLSAVVEAADLVDGRHSYWALKHPAERPDFHRREAFSLTLNQP
jgi:hypothetical protein